MTEQVEPVPWRFTITRSGGEKSYTLTVIVKELSVYLYEGVLTEEELSNWSSEIKGPKGWTEEEVLSWNRRLASGPRPRHFASLESRGEGPKGNAGLEPVLSVIRPLLAASFGETVRVELPHRGDSDEEFQIEGTTLGYGVHFPVGPDFSARHSDDGGSNNERNPMSLSDLNTLPRDFEITHHQGVLRVLGVMSKKNGPKVTPIVCGISNSGELDLRISIDPTRNPPHLSAARSSRLVFLTTPDGEPVDYVDEVGGEYLALLSDELVATGYSSYDVEFPPIGGLELTNVEIFEGQTVEVVARFLQENFPTWVLLRGIRPESDNLSWNQAKILDSFLTALRSDFYFFSFESSATEWGLYPGEVWQSPDFDQEESLFPKKIIDRALQHLSSNFPDLKSLNEFLSDKDYRWSSDVENKLMTMARTYINQETSSGEPSAHILRDCLEELLSLAGRRQD